MKTTRLLAVIFFVVLSACGVEKMSTEQLQDAMNAGGQIVAAVRNYRTAQHVLPTSLHDLVPGYIMGIPNTGLGKLTDSSTTFPADFCCVLTTNGL